MLKRAGLVAGIVGALAMTATGAIARDLGVELNLEMLLGSAITGHLDSGAWLAGLLTHLAIGGALGVIYASILGDPGVPVTTRSGIAIGALHAVIAGLLLSIVGPLHPLIPAETPEPGAFASNLGGASSLLFIAEHLLFGAIVGGACALVKVRRPQRLIAAL